MTDVPNAVRNWYLPNVWQSTPTCSYSTSSQNDHLTSLDRLLSSWMDVILPSNTKQQKSPLHPEGPCYVSQFFSADRNVTYDAHAWHDCLTTQTHSHTRSLPNHFTWFWQAFSFIPLDEVILNWISQLLTPESPLHGSCLSHTPRCLNYDCE